MNDVAAASELADVFNIGQSVENRDIRVLKVNDTNIICSVRG